MSTIINGLVIGDVHLNHPRTPTLHIITRLNAEVTCDRVFSQINFLVINGDLLDRVILRSRKESDLIDGWYSRLLFLAKKHNVCVRVVRGTPGHDCDQSKAIAIMAEEHYGKEIDVAYVETLSIEHISRFSIDVLYVPDEWRPTTEQTQREIQELLESRGIDKVDYCFVHGAFFYQLPKVSNANIKFDERFFLDRCRKQIFVNHIHKPSSFERIYAPGSFDRLSQGETEAKGFIRWTSGEVDLVQFVENKGAMIYQRVYCLFDELEEAIKHLKIQVKNTPDDSYVEVVLKQSSKYRSALDKELKGWYRLNFTIVEEDNKDRKESGKSKSERKYEPIIITPTTVQDLMFNALDSKVDDPAIKLLSLKLLKETVEHVK